MCTLTETVRAVRRSQGNPLEPANESNMRTPESLKSKAPAPVSWGDLLDAAAAASPFKLSVLKMGGVCFLDDMPYNSEEAGMIRESLNESIAIFLNEKDRFNPKFLAKVEDAAKKHGDNSAARKGKPTKARACAHPLPPPIHRTGPCPLCASTSHNPPCVPRRHSSKGP